jgi:gliding motility-associated-like protein
MEPTRLYKASILLFFIIINYSSFSQAKDGFDFKQARIEAKAKGIADKFFDEYVEHQHQLYLRKHKTTTNHIHKEPVDLGTVYNSYKSAAQYYQPASPQNAYCPNAGFEQFGFANWTGSTGDITSGTTSALFPVYTSTANAIVNPAGNNTSIVNESNFHTIMTTPATNNVYPNCVGYDSIAVRVIGTQTISEIPFVNPNGGPASVRMNAVRLFNDVGCKLTYNMALNPNNKSFSISYALVLYDGAHSPYEQPYFGVKVRDQNGNLVAGCSQYTITINSQVTTPGSSSYDPLWKASALNPDVYYRPWSTYAFDFSNNPSITAVTVEFYVGGCSLSAHFGYAYVDAECSTGGALASFCNGATSAVVNVPTGFASYQWTGPSGAVAAGVGGTSASATVSPVSAGQVFTCTAVSANGCSSVFTTTISITTVSVAGIGSTPSCPSGSSGSANVTATGSSGAYAYQWVNSSGANVGNSQTVSGLSPGTYSVTVSSTGCGTATESVVVSNAPPNFYTLSAPYCGTTAWITNNGGSNYKWYTSTGAAIAGQNTATLTINNPVNSSKYILGFTTASGCRDSIKYTLSQISGGSINVSNIKSICAGNSDATAVINLNTTASPAAYSYSVTGPSGYNSTATNTSSTTFSVSNLSIATYSVNVFDGQCFYNTTFSVTPFVFSYTLVPQNTTICSSGSTSLAANFCSSTTSSTCGIDNSPSLCATASQVSIGNGVSTNGTSTYPAPYGNYYESMHFQMLFTAAELTAAGVKPGKLTSLSFNVANINSLVNTLPNYTIKLKCTAATSATTFDMAGLSQVFTTPNLNVSTGWNLHTFQSNYYWPGNTNLLVDVCYDATNGFDNNPSSPYTTTAFTSVVYYRVDNNNTCGLTTVSGTSANRPNIKFGNLSSLGASAFTYTWLPTTNLSSTTSYSTIANPTTTTVYTLQVEPIGQTNCVQSQSSTITVATGVTPTITPISALCSNANSFSLSALPPGGTWNLTAPTSTAGVFTPSLAAIGNNTVTYNYGIAGCSETTTAIVPIEQFIPSTISGTINPLCIFGSPVNLQTSLTTSTLGAGTWSGNGITGTIFTPSVAGIAIHTLTYSTNSNPTASLCPSSSTIEIEVNTVTQPTITAIGPVCDNFSSQQLVANPTGGFWTPGSTGAQITTAGLFIPSANQIGNNKLYYTLTNSPCIKKDSITISVVQFIPATLTGALGPYCEYNEAVDLQSIQLNSGGIWSGTGVTGSVFEPTIASAGSHSLSYKTDPAPSNLCPDTQTLTIVVQAKPEANALVDDVAGCSPKLFNYSTSSYNTGNANWDFGDGSPLQNGLYASHTYTLPGTYTATITYTDNIGCVDTTTCLQSVTIYSVPVAAFEPSLDETTIINPDIQFTNQTSGLMTNTYTWNFSNIEISSAINPAYSFTNIGQYTVSLLAVSPDLCRDSVTKTITINPDVVLYVPNAFTPGNKDGLNDLFEIFLPPTGVDYSTFDLKIYDRWGELVYKTNDVTAFWNGSKNNSGEILKQDIFVWKITFKDLKKNYYQRYGNVTLLNSK